MIVFICRHRLYTVRQRLKNKNKRNIKRREKEIKYFWKTWDLIHLLVWPVSYGRLHGVMSSQPFTLRTTGLGTGANYVNILLKITGTHARTLPICQHSHASLLFYFFFVFSAQCLKEIWCSHRAIGNSCDIFKNVFTIFGHSFSQTFFLVRRYFVLSNRPACVHTRVCAILAHLFLNLVDLPSSKVCFSTLSRLRL